MTTIHETKVKQLESSVYSAWLQAENATFKMGAVRRKEHDAAKAVLREYLADETQHDHSEIIHLIRLDGYCEGCKDTPCKEIAEDAEVFDPPVMSSATDLVIAKSTAMQSSFPSPENISLLVAETRRAALIEAAKFDVNTAKGRAAIIKVAVSVRDKKVALDNAGDISKADHQKIIKEVNESVRLVKSEFQTVQDEIRKPVTDWETADKARIKAARDRLFAINTGDLTPASDSDAITAQFDLIAAITTGDDWGDGKADAKTTKERVLSELSASLAAAVVREEQAERLAELEAAEAERQRVAQVETDRIAAEEKARQDGIDSDNRVYADAVADNATFDAAAIATLNAVQKAKDDATAEAARVARKAEADRLQAIADTEAAAKKAADVLAKKNADEARAVQDKKDAAERDAKAKAERQELALEKTRAATAFRNKARTEIAKVLDILDEIESPSRKIDMLLNDDFAVLRFNAEGVKQ